MNNHKIFFAMFLVFGIIGMIRDDPVAAGDLYSIHINVQNDGGDDLDNFNIDEEDLEDLSLRLYIYDLGILLQTNPFDLDDGNNAGKFLFWEIPSNVEPGYYWARITVSNDDVREVRHKLITIV